MFVLSTALLLVIAAPVYLLHCGSRSRGPSKRSTSPPTTTKKKNEPLGQKGQTKDPKKNKKKKGRSDEKRGRASVTKTASTHSESVDQIDDKKPATPLVSCPPPIRVLCKNCPSVCAVCSQCMLCQSMLDYITSDEISVQKTQMSRESIAGRNNARSSKKHNKAVIEEVECSPTDKTDLDAESLTYVGNTISDCDSTPRMKPIAKKPNSAAVSSKSRKK